MPLSSVEIRRNIPHRKLPRVISTITFRVLDVCIIFSETNIKGNINICHVGVQIFI